MEQEKERLRKVGRKKGQLTQKLMAFRIDEDVQDILEKVQNKGRVVNEAVKEWWRSRNREEHDYSPEEDRIEDNLK